MLLELKIRNLAIIESVDIYFGPGLNVLTGETGAGKSILLTALGFVLGGKGERTLIRTGKQEAWVEAVFEVNNRILSMLKEWEITLEPSEPLALRRVINSNGRTRAYINCISVPTNVIRQISPFLLDFGRQHEQSVLMNPENHMQLLDRFANLDNERTSVEKAYRYLSEIIKEWEILKNERSTRYEKADFLRFQKEAILAVDPQPGEVDSLNEELSTLGIAEKCRELAERSEHKLYTGPGSVQVSLAASIAIIEELNELDGSINHVLEDLKNALISVEEGFHSMQIYRKSLHIDSERIEQIEERLDQLLKLQQKYGGNYESVFSRLSDIDNELKNLEIKEQRLLDLSDIIKDAKSQLHKLAFPLSEKRRKVAEELSRKVIKEIADLAMPNARFQVSFTPVKEGDSAILCESSDGKPRFIASWGMETANFLLSANPGEELRPLDKVASGGEMSRIMLALKRVMTCAFPVETFAFDEIDAGVSGAAAVTVAQKLRQIASEGASQIICISHTPQVAAVSNRHFKVEKHTEAGRTSTQVSLMSMEERIVEVSRMLSGDQTMEQALALAQELVRGQS